VLSLELLDIKIFPNRLLAPATEKSYGEMGVLLSAGYGGPKMFTNCAEVIAEGYGEKACHKKINANSLSFFLSLSLSLSLSFCLVFCSLFLFLLILLHFSVTAKSI
jgi:hypothetical protein